MISLTLTVCCLQVSQGLCEAAVKAPGDNRYCNLFPFDTSRVVLTGLATDYINASWVEMPGLERRLILTMAPLHPDSQGNTETQILSSVL